MENKKNMCVLFSAFDFDRRFVFQLRGPEMPAPGPKEKGDKKDRITEKPDPKKALGELAAAVEAKEKAPEKPYSVTKLEKIRADLLRARVDIDAKKEPLDVLAQIARRLGEASHVLRVDTSVSEALSRNLPVSESLLASARKVESVRRGEIEIRHLDIVANTFLPRDAIIWVDPMTQQERTIVLKLIDTFIAQREKEAREVYYSHLSSERNNHDLAFINRKIATFLARRKIVQALKLPQ